MACDAWPIDDEEPQLLADVSRLLLRYHHAAHARFLCPKLAGVVAGDLRIVPAARVHDARQATWARPERVSGLVELEGYEDDCHLCGNRLQQPPCRLLCKNEDALEIRVVAIVRIGNFSQRALRRVIEQ